MQNAANLDVLRRLASANDEPVSRAGSSFVNNVLDVLDRAEYRRCESGEDLEDIYRLRYNSYRSSSLVAENAQRAVFDDFDDLPNCHRFGVFFDGSLAATIRLHVVSTVHPVSPAMSVYGDILRPRVGAGERFIDPSRFAADPNWARIFPQLPFVTLRLAVLACFHFHAPFCLSMIREDHVAFYRRVFQSRLIGGPRPYGGVINTAAQLYEADVLAIKERVFGRYPFFQSTEREQRMLFDEPQFGETAPLTVIPTVKYLREAA